MVSLHKIVLGLVLSGISLELGLGRLPTLAKPGSGIEPGIAADIVQTKQNAAQTYTQAMLAGYNAAERRDYHTALINFRRALAVRPGDRYATAAIRNMETYIAQQRAEAAKQAEIARLQETLAAAVGANDWACAAATVDRLVTLVPPDSTDRARLIAYRGEVGGFIQSRDNLDQWSTICPGGQV
ncbi:hypothetical protein [Nodosilinea sp. P-1105]|uniref:hypothetical protein n=1 Tax=Nodosilinea sp. P-1105 TaxID=2546229 RepID=UPI001469A618|nr:hypothetical protein [Nodosilinea sp. P-1105]NMF84551.1 hypothetical protein [Nodosilinea sp. P-1105]